MEKLRKIYVKIKKHWKKSIAIVLALLTALTTLGIIKPDLSKKITQDFLRVIKVIEDVDGAVNE
jgi:hypothetical protein